MECRYQAVIFDWDGTLADSEAQIVTYLQSAFRQNEFPEPDAVSIRHAIGLSLEVAISRLRPNSGPADIKKLALSFRTISHSAKDGACELYPGVRQCLIQLQAEQIDLAVATGKSRAGLDRDLKLSGLSQVFHISRCADETRSKPNPQMLEEILTDLNLRPNQAVMVGDTVYDIEMARHIGMDSIAVAYGMHDAVSLLQASPRHLINDISELLPLIINPSIQPAI